jgi:rod shape-determining protein MreD
MTDGRWVIPASIIVAMALSIMPMPDSLQSMRPDWVALVCIYWIIALPQRYGVVMAWICGLFLDVLQGTLLGQYALAMAFTGFVAHKLHLQLRNFPVVQQSLGILALTALYNFILLLLDGIAGTPTSTAVHLKPPLSSMVFWPIVFGVLRDLRRRSGLH